MPRPSALSGKPRPCLLRCLPISSPLAPTPPPPAASPALPPSYPPLSTALEPGQTRASAHTDYGAVTILRSGGPGLQVLNREDVWVDVPDMDESSFIVNLGDLMSRWTNGRWLSTPHRVIVPDEGKTDAESGAPVVAKARQSIAFFHNMDMDASIETIPTCLAADGTSKYPPILAGDHLMKKHNAATQGQLLNVYA